ncbi:MAG: hypothetical protein J6X77_03965 [Bacteroidales bacterium]|nr:hypothetical protein [Bacteroidales bacterium]
MKKAFLSIIAAVLSFGMVLSCTDPAGPEPKEDSIEFSSQAEVAVPVDGILTNIAFTASAAWTAKLSDGAEAFVVMSPTSGAAGEGGITVQVRKNTGGEERKFSVTVTCGKVTGTVNFTQEAAASASTDVTTIEADGEGGTYELPITLNVSATITSSVDWIIVGETKAMETVTYLVKVAPNPSIEESRTGQVTVSPEGLEDIVVEVEQKKFVPVLNFTVTIPQIPQAGGTVEIPFESNMEVDLFAEGIEGAEVSLGDGVVVITAPENPAMTPLNMYVLLTASDYEGDGTTAAINVYQLGLANIEWSVSIVDKGVNVNIANYSVCPLAVSGDYALVSDGVDVHVFSRADGSYVNKVIPVLGEGSYPQSLASDDAGNIIMADMYADGTSNCKVWWAGSIDATPAELLTFNNNLGGNMGNFRVKGDISSSAVVSSVVSVSKSWAAWQITSGALEGERVSAVHPADQGNVWSPYYQVCEPMGDKIADGFFYGSYPARPNIWYCSNPASNTWASVLATAQDWDTDMNAMDVVNVGSKKILLYLASGFFTYSNVHFGICDVTDPTAPVLLGTFGKPFYSGAEPTSCYGGSGIVGIVSADGKTLEIYVAEGSRDTLAKITIPTASL